MEEGCWMTSHSITRFPLTATRSCVMQPAMKRCFAERGGTSTPTLTAISTTGTNLLSSFSKWLQFFIAAAKPEVRKKQACNPDSGRKRQRTHICKDMAGI